MTWKTLAPAQNRRSNLGVVNKREPKNLFEQKKKDDKWALGLICWPSRCKCKADDVWAHRGGTSTGKGHVSGVKLETADGTRMFPVQHSHLHPTLRAPDVDPPVLWACTTRLCLAHIFKKWKKTWNLSNCAHRSWQTASREWSTPPGTTLYCCYSPSIQFRHTQNSLELNYQTCITQSGRLLQKKCVEWHHWKHSGRESSLRWWKWESVSRRYWMRFLSSRKHD